MDENGADIPEQALKFLPKERARSYASLVEEAGEERKRKKQKVFLRIFLFFRNRVQGVTSRGPPVEGGRLHSESLLNLGPEFQDWVPGLLGLIAMR